MLGDQVAPDSGDRRVDALVGIDRGIGDRAELARGVHHPADEVISGARQPKAVIAVFEQVFVALPQRHMHVAATAGEVEERLWHEGRAQAMLLGDGLDHIFEERHPVGGHERVGELPVHLELAVGVLVVVLVRRPAELEHGIANLADHVVAAHQCRLVVARLRLRVRRVADRRAVGAHQEKLAFDAGLQRIAGLRGLRRHLLQDVARRLLNQLAVHVRVGGEPADLALPGKLDQARWIGNGEHVGIGGSHVEPAGETGEARAVLGHVADGRGRRQLGAQRAEQIDIGNQEIFDPALAGLDC